MTIKVTIKENSPAAKAFKKYMAEKAAFREAVKSGNAINYAKKSSIKFATPV